MTTETQPPIDAAAPARTLATSISRGAGRKCAAQHFGAWAIEPKWFRSAADAIRAGTWKPQAYDEIDEDDAARADKPGEPYDLSDGVAIVCIDGQMTKRGSSFGGASTVAVREALRTAAVDDRVKSIVLHICSPGGTCAGTGDLADDILAVRNGKFGTAKPVMAYIADMGCSAAYWVASQCETIYANSTAVIGSIGTYTVLEDNTGQQEQWGVKYRVVSTGPYKGLGADGVITDALVADVQREVNELNAVFLAAVQNGRGSKIADLASIADGRAWGADVAQRMGLVDFVMSLDDALAQERKASVITTQMEQLAAATGRDGTPAPKAGKAVVAVTGDERIVMDPKKRAYLESLGLRTDATDEQAQAFYDLLSTDKQAAADAAEEAGEPADDTAPADTMPAAAKDGKIANIAAASVLPKLSEIVAACDGDKAMAVDYFEANMSVAQAKAAYAGVKAANAKAAEAKADADRARFEAKGQPALPVAGAAGAADDNTPEAKAKAEWSKMSATQRDEYADEETYVAVRKREIASGK